MKVYLDNNIFVDVENGSVLLSQLSSNPDVSFFFSETHIEELINGLVKHLELKNIRLHTIEQLCFSNYIEPEAGPFKGGFEEMSPQSAFDLLMRFKYFHDRLFNYTNSMLIDRDIMLKSLSLEKIEVGNYKPSEIFIVLNERMKEHWGYDIKIYLEKQCASEGRAVFSSLFNLLDFVCYWHDKKHTARLYDSSHAYFAHFCDVLVSNDKRMRIKAEAVYSYLGINTQVCTADEFLKQIAKEKLK